MPQVCKKSLVKAKSKRLDKYISCNDLGDTQNQNLNFVKKVDSEFKSNGNHLKHNSTRNLVENNFENDTKVEEKDDG